MGAVRPRARQVIEMDNQGLCKVQLSDKGGGLNRSTQHFIFEGQDWSVAIDQGFRRGFTTAEKTELWDRWQRGKSLKALGRGVW